MVQIVWPSSAPESLALCGRLHSRDDDARSEAKDLLLKFADGTIDAGATRWTAWNRAISEVAWSRGEREIDAARALVRDLHAIEALDV